MGKSIIYFAREYPVTFNTRFKIGESGRGIKRQKDSKFPKNHIIDEIYVTKIPTKAHRLYIESYLRLYLVDNYNCCLIGNDTFVGKDYRTILKIKKDFHSICVAAQRKYESG